jgi:hypothetical protein
MTDKEKLLSKYNHEDLNTFEWAELILELYDKTEGGYITWVGRYNPEMNRTHYATTLFGLNLTLTINEIGVGDKSMSGDLRISGVALFYTSPMRNLYRLAEGRESSRPLMREDFIKKVKDLDDEFSYDLS